MKSLHLLLPSWDMKVTSTCAGPMEASSLENLYYQQQITNRTSKVRVIYICYITFNLVPPDFVV